MLIGTTIFKMDGNAYFSPQFPRGGLAATFTVKATHVASSPTLTITVQHRNSDETTWSDAGSFTVISSVGVVQLDVTGLKEVLRFRYAFDAGDGAGAGVHFLMQAPSWRPYP